MADHASSFARKPLDHVVRKYDRVAPVYAAFEPLFAIFPPARRRAVAALGLKPGDRVLEIGAGSGRNLPYLLDAIGPTGAVTAVDASPGMLAQAKRLIGCHSWHNVELIEGDAAQVALTDQFDAVLFSLSYSVIPEPKPVLAMAWQALRPGGRLVIMDAGITRTPLRRVLAPLTTALLMLAPGDPYSEPWRDLAAYGRVRVERFLLNLYFVCIVQKPSPV